MTDNADVVVIGAGVAGLAASEALRAGGYKVIVLEAQDRIGGRAHTDHSLGFPFDHGCHWLHSADVNPLVPLAQRMGFDVHADLPRSRVSVDGKLQSEAEQADWEHFYDRQCERLSSMRTDRPDLSCGELLQAGGEYPVSRWRPLFDGIFSMHNGVEPEVASAVDQIRYRDTFDNRRLREGYGDFIARLFHRQSVRAGCRVLSVHWRGPAITVNGAVNGSGANRAHMKRITARWVVVTVSSSVLAAESIAFVPGLPESKRAAARQVRLGFAEKIGLRLCPDRLAQPLPSSSLTTLRGTEVVSFQIRPFGLPLISAYVGGRLARRVGSMADSDIQNLLLAHLCGPLAPSGIDRAISGITRSRWSVNPYTRGAYSTALPGVYRARATLAEPVAGKLFFAGEATSPDFYSTAHGAYLSGQRAAAQIAAL